jgi:hypothetical protein
MHTDYDPVQSMHVEPSLSAGDLPMRLSIYNGLEIQDWELCRCGGHEG